MASIQSGCLPLELLWYGAGACIIVRGCVIVVPARCSYWQQLLAPGYWSMGYSSPCGDAHARIKWRASAVHGPIGTGGNQGILAAGEVSPLGMPPQGTC